MMRLRHAIFIFISSIFLSACGSGTSKHDFTGNWGYLLEKSQDGVTIEAVGDVTYNKDGTYESTVMMNMITQGVEGTTNFAVNGEWRVVHDHFYDTPKEVFDATFDGHPVLIQILQLTVAEMQTVIDKESVAIISDLTPKSFTVYDPEQDMTAHYLRP